jgi:hypothetical protein
LRISAACIQDLRDGHFELFAAQLLVDLDFDRKAVAIVAGNIRSIEAGHGFGLDDEVLEALVESVAEMNGPVGVGGSIVEQIDGAAAAGLAQLFIEAQLSPTSEAKWLILR